MFKYQGYGVKKTKEAKWCPIREQKKWVNTEMQEFPFKYQSKRKKTKTNHSVKVIGYWNRLPRVVVKPALEKPL